MAYLPDANEQDADAGESDHEEDSQDDELDLSAPRAFGKQSARTRTPTTQFGYQIDTSQIAMTEDSE